MAPGSLSPPIESGYVRHFKKDKGYGHIALDSGEENLFFFVIELMKANMDTIEPGVRVTFTRGFAKDGRPKVSKFVEIDGKKVVEGSYSLVKGRFVFHRNESPQFEEVPPEAPAQKVEIPQRPPVVVPNKPVASRINKEDWVTVTLKKVRPEHTTYAVSELWGQIKVPWSVMQAAKIKSARSAERFEVRCQEGDDLPVAHEIRRY